jgi:hypothetical protein
MNCNLTVNLKTHDVSGPVSAEVTGYRAMPYLKRLFAGLSARRSGFASRAIHLIFVVGKVALGQVSLRVLRFSPVSIIPPPLHIHSCIIWGMDSAPVSGQVPQRHSHPIATVTTACVVYSSWVGFALPALVLHLRGLSLFIYITNIYEKPGVEFLCEDGLWEGVKYACLCIRLCII